MDEATKIRAQKGDRYTYRSSGQLYEVLEVALHTETLLELVVYCVVGSLSPCWAMPREKFQDGRFTPV